MSVSPVGQLALDLLTVRYIPSYDDVLDCIREHHQTQRYLAAYFRQPREKIFKRRPGDTTGPYLYFPYLSFCLSKGTIRRFDERTRVINKHEADAKRGLRETQFQTLVIYSSKDYSEEEILSIRYLLFNYFISSDVNGQYNHNATERLLRSQRPNYFNLHDIIEHIHRLFHVDAAYFAIERNNSQRLGFEEKLGSNITLIPQHVFGNVSPLVSSAKIESDVKLALRFNQHLSGRFTGHDGKLYYKLIPIVHYYEADGTTSKELGRRNKRARPPFEFSIKRRPLGCLLIANKEGIKWLCYSVTRALLAEHAGGQHFLTQSTVVNAISNERAKIQETLQTSPIRNCAEFDKIIKRFSGKIARSLVYITQAHSAAIRLFNPVSKSLEIVASWHGTRVGKDPSFREAIGVGEGHCSLNAFVFTALNQGEHAYIHDLRRPLPKTLEERGLKKILPGSPKALSEICLPIFKSGLCVGTIDLEAWTAQAFDMDTQFCHQLAQMLGDFLEAIDRSSDAGWLPRLSFIHYATHRVSKVRRNSLRNSKDAIDSALDFIEHRLTPNYIDPHRKRRVNTSTLWDDVLMFIKGKDKLAVARDNFLTLEGALPQTIPAKFAYSVQVILENIIENAGEHDNFSGHLVIRCGYDRLRHDGRAPIPLEIEYTARKALYFANDLKEVGIAPRWDSSDTTYHLGMYLVGVHTRLLGGSMWIDRASHLPRRAKPFRVVIRLPMFFPDSE